MIIPYDEIESTMHNYRYILETGNIITRNLYKLVYKGIFKKFMQSRLIRIRNSYPEIYSHDIVQFCQFRDRVRYIIDEANYISSANQISDTGYKMTVHMYKGPVDLYAYSDYTRIRYSGVISDFVGGNELDKLHGNPLAMATSYAIIHDVLEYIDA